MKCIIFLVALVAAVSAGTFETYPTKYDSLDIDAILHNSRLVNTYVLCLLKKGKCNEEGAILRDVIPDALITGCKKCNEVQKVSVEKVVHFLINERNTDWQELLHVYDPEGVYYAQYSHYLEKL